MATNIINSASSAAPGEDITCPTLDLNPCTQDIALMKAYYLEGYCRLPQVRYRIWTRTNVDDRWGDIQNTKTYFSEILLNSEFQWDRHIKEFKNGKWIRTSKTEMYLLEAQTVKFNLIPKEGDIIYLIDRWVEILSVNKAEIIQGTSVWIKWHLIVDTQQMTEG